MKSTLDYIYSIYQQHSIVCTDTRKIQTDVLFFALKGSNFNGNHYAKEALEKGAAFAVIDEIEYQENDRYLLVDDVLATLQALARHHRRQFDIPILAITGSNGKTTTKELVSSVLSAHYRTHFTKGNFNNHIGVPLTLLEMPLDTEIAVIEMGANHQKEIDFLCHIAEPTHGLITNIGKAHLEGFGGIEGVKKGKSELYRYLHAQKGVLFVNQDEAHLKELSKDMLRVIPYGKSADPSMDTRMLEVSFLSKTPFLKAAFLAPDGILYTVESQLVGAYNFNNMMTAIVIGKYFKVPPEKIKQAISDYIPSNNRSQIINKETNTIILDAYNANPTSMQQALKNLSERNTSHTIAILGDMLEMGEYSQAEHQNIIELAKTLNIETIITVGTEFGKVTGFENLHFKDTAALKAWWTAQNFQNASILIKGSRGIGLEKLLS